MTSPDPLDRVAWSALEGRHSRFALSCGRARRYDPACAPFAAVADRSRGSLADLGRLIARHGEVGMLEPDPPTRVPGAVVVSREVGLQMVATREPEAPPPSFAARPLVETDGAAMLELALLTRPGPFSARTHRLGRFVGVVVEGRLVAMAGERMRPDGFVEVSGVCTHPDHRGRGYAGALTRLVGRRVLASGEVPFLHVYASNRPAIALYEGIGFVARREVSMTRLAPA